MDTSTKISDSNTSKVGEKKSPPKTKRDRKRKMVTENHESVTEETANFGDDNQQQSNCDTVYSCMTLDEKKRLLNVIKTKGFGVIYTPELLLDEFPGRSKNEISFMIENYKKKGKEFANKLKTSANIDLNEKTGTEHWYSLIHNIIPHLSKRDDMSDLFIELFQEFSEEAHENSKPEEQANYDQIYLYLAEILGGKYPRDLNAFDSLVVLSLLETLRQYSETFDCHEEEDFMQDGSWWKKQDDQSTGENHEDGSSDNNSGSYVIRKYFESCLNYPKIRKIRHCLNPLNVPMNMLQDEHKKVSKLLSDSLTEVQTVQD